MIRRIAIVSLLYSFTAQSQSITINSGPAVYATAQPLVFYVDGTKGSDSNAPCTLPGSGACKTVQAAVNLVPKHIRNPVTINVATGTYTGAYIGGFTFDVGDQPVSATNGPYLRVVCTPVNVTPTTGPGSGTLTGATQAGSGIFGSGNPGPANWATATDSNATWTAHDLQHDLIAITAGTGAGEVAMIDDNTATGITLVGSWPTTTPDATSQFQIETATGGTVFNTGLPQPPGAAGYAYNTSAASVFWTSSNNAFSQGGTSTAFFGWPIGDPAISFDYCDFEVPSLSNRVAALHVNHGSVAIRFSTLKAVRGVFGNGDIWFQSNYCDISAANEGGCIKTAGTASLGGTGTESGVFATGNYVTGALYSSGFGNAFIEAEAASPVAALQNHVDSLAHGFSVGQQVYLVSVGNDWNGLVSPFTTKLTDTSSSTAVVLVDGDNCVNSSSACADLTQGALLFETAYDAFSGSGNAFGFLLGSGAKLKLTLAPTMTATTPLQMDGVTEASLPSGPVVYLGPSGTRAFATPSASSSVTNIATGTYSFGNVQVGNGSVLSNLTGGKCTMAGGTTCTATTAGTTTASACFVQPQGASLSGCYPTPGSGSTVVTCQTSNSLTFGVFCSN